MSIASRIESIEGHIEQAYDELQGLGADLTNVNKNIENISMVLDDIYDSMPQVSGEGTNLTLDDTRVGKIKSTLKGNTSQDGTPTPTSPIPINVVSGDNEIEVCGKNLCKIEAHTYQDLSRAPSVGQPLPLFNTNGTIKIKIDLSTFDKSKTYTVSARNDITNLRCFYCDSNDLYITAESTGNPKTLSIPTNASILYIFIKISNVTDLTPIPLEDYELQIEVGSSASAYEAYNGNTYNIDLGVKNLISFGRTEGTYSGNGTTFEEGKYYPNMVRDSGNVGTSCEMVSYTSDILTIKGHYAMGVGYPIKCEPNKDYFVKVTSTDTNARLWVSFYDNTGTYISGSSNNADLERATTSPSNASWIVPIFAVYGNSVTSVTFSNIKVIEGNKNQSISENPIELCKVGDYQDYFYKDSGKWYLHKEIGKVVLNGSENWQSASSAVSGTSRFYYDDDNVLNPAYINTPLSNMFKSLRWVDIYNQDTTTRNGVACWDDASHQGRLIIRIDNAFADTVSAFKTWLGTNLPIVYYVLKTPTTTEITYQPLIDQLNLLEKAMSKDGQTNISQVNNDLPFIISASALKEWQENTSLNSTLSMVNPLSLGNTLNTQENNTQPIEVDNIEPLEEEENEES